MKFKPPDFSIFCLKTFTFAHFFRVSDEAYPVSWFLLWKFCLNTLNERCFVQFTVQTLQTDIYRKEW